MTPEREKLIRRMWSKHGRSLDFNKMPVWKVPVPGKVSTSPRPLDLAVQMPVFDTLEFRIESGTFEGRPAHQIVCEGVVVERWLDEDRPATHPDTGS